jgi:hypothetical protein
MGKCYIKWLMILMLLLVSGSVQAATVQFPPWYSMTLELGNAPQVNKSLEVKLNIKALIGDLQTTKVRLIFPEDWQIEKAQQTINLIKEGEEKTISFTLTPKSYLAQGSIIAEALFNVPVTALARHIRRELPQQEAGMIEALNAWPKVSKRYAEISFALLEEESFYPLDSAMWLNYYDKLAPREGFKGPVFYDNPVVSAYQAQTDVEMFEKLIGYVKTDPALAAKLAASGVDVNKKRYDQLNGLYVLAVRSFLENNPDQARGFITRLENEIEKIDSDLAESLLIATYNLKGIIFWSLNNKRLAEDFLKKAFYHNRKHPLQRYVLRNIALLMLAKDEKTTAEHMMRLAVNIRSGYTQLEKEYEKVKSP